MSTDQSGKEACIACKHQRRRCIEDCLLKPYFRSNSSQYFQYAQMIFGVSNMNKILKRIRVEDRPRAVQSLVWEASIWKQDPVNGPLGQFARLQQEDAFLKTQLLNFRQQNYRNFTSPQLGFRELNNNGVGVLPNHNILIAANNGVNFQSGGGLRPQINQGQERFGYSNALEGFERGNLGASRQNLDNVGLVLNRVRSGGIRDPISQHNENQFGAELKSDQHDVKFSNMQQFPSPTQQLEGLYRDNSIQDRSSKQACIACKHQRRRCREDCLLKPYFGSISSQDFQSAQKVFGISNMTKILRQNRVEDRPRAVQSLVWEASIWRQDPVNGPLGQFAQLQQEITFLKTQLNQQNYTNFNSPQLGFQELNNHGVGVLPNHNIHIPSSGGLRPQIVQGQERFGYLNALQGFESGNFGVSRQNLDNVGLVLNSVRSGGIQYPISHHNQNQFGVELESNQHDVKFGIMQQFPSPTQQLEGLYHNNSMQGQSYNANVEIAGDHTLPMCTSSTSNSPCKREPHKT